MKTMLNISKIKNRNCLATFIVVCMMASNSGHMIAQSPDYRVPLVVSSQWLEDHISSPDIVVLHISTIINDYKNGHIPGARYLWPGLLILSSENESTFPAEPQQIKKVIEGLGVSNNSHIVLCGQYGNLVQVCRIFVTLNNIGLNGRLSILEGGFDEWKASGREVTTDSRGFKKGKLNIFIKSNFVSADWVVNNLDNKSFILVDGRSQAYYEGTTGISRPGHIPGAKNLPATDLYDSKSFHFASSDSLKVIFKSLQISSGARPVFYCNTGNSASVDFVAALIAGYEPLIYDGSMEEWGSMIDLPVEKK